MTGDDPGDGDGDRPEDVDPTTDGDGDVNGNGDPPRCGSTDTTNGEPCERGQNCPFHQQSDPPSATGRPTKLTKQRQERIASLLEAGQSIASASRATGIAPSTFHAWVRRGREQDDGVFSEFHHRTRRARGVGEIQLIKEAREAARESKNAQALLRLAELQYPGSLATRGGDSVGALEAGERGPTLNVLLQSEADGDGDGATAEERGREYALQPEEARTGAEDSDSDVDGSE